MAEFCQQCSLEIFNEDFKELAGLGHEELLPGYGWQALCEGCGMTLVDNDGKCVNKDCKKHGKEK